MAGQFGPQLTPPGIDFPPELLAAILAELQKGRPLGQGGGGIMGPVAPSPEDAAPGGFGAKLKAAFAGVGGGGGGGGGGDGTSGIGSTAGTAIGTAAGGPVGGAIGGAIGGAAEGALFGGDSGISQAEKNIISRQANTQSVQANNQLAQQLMQILLRSGGRGGFG